MNNALLLKNMANSYHLFHISGRWLSVEDKGILINAVKQHIEIDPKSFIVDLEKVKTLNSEGINELIRSIAVTKENSLKIVFINVSDKIKELLNIIQLNSVITICDTLTEAEQLLTNEQE